MKLTPVKLRCLQNLQRAMLRGRVFLHDFVVSCGGNRGSWYVAMLALETRGFIAREQVSDKRSIIELTEKGRTAIERAKAIELISPARTAIATRPYVGPTQLVSDEEMRALYRGGRYSLGGFREIVDRRPVPASRALEGYRGESP